MSLFNGLAGVTFLSTAPNGQGISNTFHVSNPGAGSPPDLTELTALGTDLVTWFGTAYRATLGTTSTLVNVTTRQVSDPTTPSVILEAVTVVNGAGSRSVGAGSSVPYSLCGVLSLHTPNASRRSRGHMFLPPCQVSGPLAGNLLNTGDAYYTNAVALAAKFAAGCGVSPTWTGSHLSNYGLVIYSKTAAKVGAPSVSLCSAATINPSVRWLRSRERGTT